MTVGELRARMAAAEIMEWRVYWQRRAAQREDATRTQAMETAVARGLDSPRGRPAKRMLG